MTDREKAFILHAIAQYDFPRALALTEKWGIRSDTIYTTYPDFHALPGIDARVDGESDK